MGKASKTRYNRYATTKRLQITKRFGADSHEHSLLINTYTLSRIKSFFNFFLKPLLSSISETSLRQSVSCEGGID